MGEDSRGNFTVIYSPKFTKFLDSADDLATNDIPSVVYSTLGLSLDHVRIHSLNMNFV